MVEQTAEITLSKKVQSAIAKPQTKNVSTQVIEIDKIITSSSKVIWPSNMKSGKSHRKHLHKLQHQSQNQQHQRLSQ